MTLSDKHLAEFRLSGISDDMVAAAGIYSVDSKQVREVLGYQPSHMTWGEGWAIPFRFPDEPAATYTRVKLDFPRHDADGKTTKYESPRGKANRPYFPPGFWKAWEAKAEVVITEGEKKALKATQEGLACVGLVGVWGFQQKRLKDDQGRKYGKTELVPELATLNWAGRTVHIVYDSDAATKEGVRFAEAKLAEVLTRQGAKVKIVRLPPGAEGTKVGLDDYLVAHPVADLKILLAAGIEAEKPGKLGPMDWAQMLIETRHTPAGLSLRWWRDEFFFWRRMEYFARSNTEMDAIIIDWLDKNGGPAEPGFAHKVAACVAALARVDFRREMPLWLDGGQPADASGWQAMADGIINVKALALGVEYGPETRRDHTPDFFSTVCLPYCYDPFADCPTWEDFLAEVLPDPEMRALLQEWFGYNLIFDTSQHKFLLMVGEGANGKSVALEVLEAMLGQENVSHLPLEGFGQRFALAPTMGKLANIIPEVGELAKPDEAIFKAFVAGDPVQVDRKNREPVQVRPTARVTIATNAKPRWTDKSEGIWRRMLLVPFNVQIAEEDQDKGLARRIVKEELPGVFKWALAGLTRLLEQGQFTRPAKVTEEMDEYKRETNPARDFLLDECCEGTTKRYVTVDELYQEYKVWCPANGHHLMTSNNFGKEIGRVFKGAKKARVTMQDGRKCVVYWGLARVVGAVG